MRQWSIGDKVIMKDMTIEEFHDAGFPSLIRPGKIYEIQDLSYDKDEISALRYRGYVFRFSIPLSPAHWANLTIQGEELEMNEDFEGALRFYERYHMSLPVERVQAFLKFKEEAGTTTPEEDIEHLRKDLNKLKVKIKKGKAMTNEISDMHKQAEAIQYEAQGKAGDKDIDILKDMIKEMEVLGGIIGGAVHEIEWEEEETLGISEHRMEICPYCGKELKLPSPPNYCPYCKERLVI